MQRAQTKHKAEDWFAGDDGGAPTDTSPELDPALDILSRV